MGDSVRDKDGVGARDSKLDLDVWFDTTRPEAARSLWNVKPHALVLQHVGDRVRDKDGASARDSKLGMDMWFDTTRPEAAPSLECQTTRFGPAT